MEWLLQARRQTWVSSLNGVTMSLGSKSSHHIYVCERRLHNVQSIPLLESGRYRIWIHYLHLTLLYRVPQGVEGQALYNVSWKELPETSRKDRCGESRSMLGALFCSSFHFPHITCWVLMLCVALGHVSIALRIKGVLCLEHPAQYFVEGYSLP